MFRAVVLQALNPPAPAVSRTSRPVASLAHRGRSAIGIALAAGLLLGAICIAGLFDGNKAKTPPRVLRLPLSVTTLVGQWVTPSFDRGKELRIRWLEGQRFEFSARDWGSGWSGDWATYRGEIAPLGVGRAAIGSFTGSGPLGAGGQWLVFYQSPVLGRGNRWQYPLLQVCSSMGGFFARAISQKLLSGTITKEETGLVFTLTEEPAQLQEKLLSLYWQRSGLAAGAQCTSLWQATGHSIGGAR